MAVMVTGANGFVGRALVRRLEQQGDQVLPVYRDLRPTGIAVGNIDAHTHWGNALQGVTSLVHTAARVHVMKDGATDPLAEFRSVNTAGTLRLARCAAEAGVRRFVFLSSIKVNGEETLPGKPYTAEDPATPHDPYGISKKEAEDQLRALARETAMEIVIIRPPLVYGPGVKANFLSMMRWLDRGLPLPLGSIRTNRRSLVSVDNLTDLIARCLSHVNAANRTFLASDNQDVSTTELLELTASALGKPAKLIPIPQAILSGAATLLGKKAVAQRLCGSLQVDASKTLSVLDWTPPLSLEEGLDRTAHAYKKHTLN